jgi:hypothetical protein
MELISENRSMTETLEEYGSQKSNVHHNRQTSGGLPG